MLLCCYAGQVHSWGVLLCSAHPGENEGEPIFKDLSPADLLARLQAELERVVHGPGAQAWGTAGVPMPASVDDIMAAEAKAPSAATEHGMLFDWKVERLTRGSLAKLMKGGDDGVRGTALGAHYSLGKTRPDFDGFLHVATLVAAGSYAAMLQLAIHEVGNAVAQSAGTVMVFYGACRQLP